MTTTLKITTNGPYVCTVTDKNTGTVRATVGPGSLVETTIYFEHGKPNDLLIEEREANEDERSIYNAIEQLKRELYNLQRERKAT